MEFSDSLHRYFVDQLAGHARADNAAGPGFVLAAADLQLRQLEKLAEHGSPEVGVLTASYAEFTGWLLQDSGDNVGALRPTDQAVELAEVFGDSSLTAYNLMRKSNILTSLHEWQRARSVAQKAVVLAERAHRTCSRCVCVSTRWLSPTCVMSGKPKKLSSEHLT